MHDGRVIISGLPEDVVNNDNVRRVYLGKDFNIQ
jgi:lipopolysaccharide export system ATP-binding protein